MFRLLKKNRKFSRRLCFSTQTNSPTKAENLRFTKRVCVHTIKSAEICKKKTQKQPLNFFYKCSIENTYSISKILLFYNYCHWHGFPRKFGINYGSCFLSLTFISFCKKFKIKNIFFSIVNHRSNRVLKRFYSESEKVSQVLKTTWADTEFISQKVN